MATLSTMCKRAIEHGFTHLVAANGETIPLGNIDKYNNANSNGWFFNGAVRECNITKYNRQWECEGFYKLTKKELS